MGILLLLLLCSAITETRSSLVAHRQAKLIGCIYIIYEKRQITFLAAAIAELA